MKLINRVAAILMLVSITGCGEGENPVKAADTVVLKTQLETLDQAKQLGQVLQDAAAQQRRQVERETK